MNGKTKLYRFMEMVPGLLTWGTFIAAVFLSYFQPLWVAVFIILFDLYWVLKALNIGMHLVFTFRKISLHRKRDWLKRCAGLNDVQTLIAALEKQRSLSGDGTERDDLEDEMRKLRELSGQKLRIDFKGIYHLILVPYVREPYEVLTASINSYVASNYPKDKMILVLACEERSGEQGREVAARIKQEYQHSFFRVLVSVHPDGIAGEAKTKGANITHAARRARELLDELEIPHIQAIVSAFDADSIVMPEYFAQLTYTYLLQDNPARCSYQPVPIYNNNVWDAPAFNRLVAVNSSFWQMVESSRPDRLVTFSSHSMSMQALVDVDYWPVDVISEDSQIFWRCFLHYHGNYQTVPLFTFISLDAVVLENYWESLIGQYKQNRRWAWGIVDWPYVVQGFSRDSLIPLWKKLLYGYRLLEGHYFWATAALMIAALGWLPLFLGSARLSNKVFAVNLPQVTGTIMTVSTVFLVLFVALYFILLPRRPVHHSKLDTLFMALQWALMPVSSIIFGGLPAIDAQTRLLMGRYMEFWVTPKVRFSEAQGATARHLQQ